MKKIILCEGKTDAILLSYFLIKRFGWQFIKEQVVGLPSNKDNEVLNWYRHQEDPHQELAIWGVGSINEIPKKLSEVVNRTCIERSPDNRFGRIVLLFDRDILTRKKCMELVKEWIDGCSRINTFGKVILDKWLIAKLVLNKTPPEEYEVQILPIALPKSKKGNLEVFLVDCLKDQSEEDKLLVEKTRRFISRLPDNPYLHKERCCSKACLGSILSVISPDWVFSEMHRRLTQIEWEKIESVLAIYGKLGEL
jgi:hypothetical protein